MVAAVSDVPPAQLLGLLWTYPLLSIRQHLSYDDYLEDKSEDYQNCSVHNHMHTDMSISYRWTVFGLAFFWVCFCVCLC